jgi:hypothetical protein
VIGGAAGIASLVLSAMNQDDLAEWFALAAAISATIGAAADGIECVKGDSSSCFAVAFNLLAAAGYSDAKVIKALENAYEPNPIPNSAIPNSHNYSQGAGWLAYGPGLLGSAIDDQDASDCESQ